LWPESRMALPLGSSLLASILRKCRGHRVQTRMGRSQISIVDGAQEREVHGYSVRRVRWWHWVSPLPGDHLATQIRACIFERKWNGDRAELPRLKEKKDQKIKTFFFFRFVW